MRLTQRKIKPQGITAFHGTNAAEFGSFDLAKVGPCNVGLHFGSLAAAGERVDYLCGKAGGDGGFETAKNANNRKVRAAA